MNGVITSNAVRLLNVVNSSFIPVRNKRVWMRKPLGSPVAKSKMFRIPQKPVLPADEVAEIKRLYDNYRTQMKSLRVYFYEQSLKQADTGEAAQLQHKLEEEEHQRLMEENRHENEVTAKLREQWLKARSEKIAERALKALSKKEEVESLFDLSCEQFIQQQQALPIIKEEDIEKAILEALANPVDYNFAIDRDGYIFRGKETTLEKIPEENRERLHSR